MSKPSPQTVRLLGGLAAQWQGWAQSIDINLGMMVAGGLPDVARLVPAARLLGASDLMLGSAVVIASRWALAVSHCLPTDPDDLSLLTSPRISDKLPIVVEVDKVYWQDGHRARVGKGEWHPAAAQLTGAHDQIVLLHLKTAMPKFGFGFAALPGAQLPQADDFVLVAGYGEDEIGNYPSYAQIALARYHEPRPHWRGSIYRDRHVLLNGMVRKYDSGAPLFLPDISTLRHWNRLLGLHTSRNDAAAGKGGMPEEGVATFLPLAPAVQDWILRRMRAKRPPARPLRQPSGMAAGANDFILRNAHNCLRVLSDNALCNLAATAHVWKLNSVSSSNQVFQKCEYVEIKLGAGNLPYMKFLDRSGQRGQPILLERDRSNHWFYGIDPQGTEFYVFAREPGSVGASNCRRIRIEAFVRGNTRIRPGEDTIDDARKLPLGTVEKVTCTRSLGQPFTIVTASSGLAEKPDQDDQTNGYEGPP